MPRRLAIVLVGLIVVAIAALSFLTSANVPAISVHISPIGPIPADGRTFVNVRVGGQGQRALRAEDITADFISGARRLRLDSVQQSQDGGVLLTFRSGVQPGDAELEIRARGNRVARVSFSLKLAPGDRHRDGTPDFLRLDSQADREAFRRWFVLLAESQYLSSPDRLPKEINDCAALVRFAYREALREHSAPWAAELGLPVLAGSASVEKYTYPFTPLQAGLFRIRAGPFSTADLNSGVFTQFADAQTLQLWNTHFISRDVWQARPGDLLFYRQREQDLPFHVMIFVGGSSLAPPATAAHAGGESFVVYHTGPIGRTPGEIRRVALRELLQHPEARWRPLPGNGNFLGVYRWNILREGQ